MSTIPKGNRPLVPSFWISTLASVVERKMPTAVACVMVFVSREVSEF